MRRYKAIFLLLILALIGCLCGCHQQCSFSIGCENLPDNYSIYILVKPTDNDTINDDPDQKGTEIYGYNEDGWMITDLLRNLCTTHLEQGLSIPFEEKDSLIGFCEQYKSIKVALCDENGCIVGMSEEFPLVCKDKFAVVTNAEFDTEDFSLERAQIYGRNFIFSDSEEILVLILWLMMTAICNISLFATFIFYTFKMQQLTRKSVILRCVLLSIGEVVLRGIHIANRLVPYLNINDSKLDLKPTIIEYPWIVGWIMLVIYLKVVGTKESAEKAYAQKEDGADSENADE